MNKILLDGKSLTFEQLYNIAFNDYQIVLDDDAMEKSADARKLLFKLADEGYPVYGLNRGVGWNKDKYVFSEFFDRYNKNLLYTHALGMGDEASIPEVRAMMAVRLNTALCASTGINTDILVMETERILKLSNLMYCLGMEGLNGSPKEGDVLAFATMQKAYTALDAENRALANPSSMDFFAVAGNIEDHATNATLVADKGLQMIENLKYMLGMEAIHCAQAIDLRKQETVVELGVGTQIVYDQIRDYIPYYDKDRILSIDIKKAFEIMDSHTLIEKVENALH